MKFPLRAAIFPVFALFLCISNTAPATENADPGFLYDEDVVFESQHGNSDCPQGDGIRLAANLHLPAVEPPEQGFPGLVFVPGWASTEHEYQNYAEIMAQQGFAVLSYSTRGAGLSEGTLTVAGPLDVADFCSAVDWLIANAPVDPDRVGAFGMSYGGGISLNSLAVEPRIKVVAATSAWADLKDNLYEGQTPNRIWIGNLLWTGRIKGRVDQEVIESKDSLYSRNNIAETLAWAARRSPITYVEQINQRQGIDPVTGETFSGVPLYLNKNLNDNLFKANRVIDLFEAWEGPKRMQHHLGVHSFAEQPGLAGGDDRIMSQISVWFRYWLQGENNGARSEPLMTFETKAERDIDVFMDWPSPNLAEQRWHLSMAAADTAEAMALAAEDQTQAGEHQYLAGPDSGATMGIPMLTPFFESAGWRYVTPLDEIDPEVGAVFLLPAREQALQIRGNSKVSLWLRSDFNTPHLVGYLFSVAPNGQASFITHGPITVHDYVPHTDVQAQFQLGTVAFDVPAGHRLAFMVDSRDPLYAPPTRDNYDITLLQGPDTPSFIDVPVRIASETLPDAAQTEDRSVARTGAPDPSVGAVGIWALLLWGLGALGLGARLRPGR